MMRLNFECNPKYCIMIKKSAFLVVGPIQSGKTYLFNQILTSIKQNNPTIGFTEECLYKNKNRVGYDLLLNLGDKIHRFPFVRIKDRITLDSPNLFQFDMNTITTVNSLVKINIKITKPPLLYFDEYGRIESKGRGLLTAMKMLINQMENQNISYSTLFSTRKQNLDSLMHDIQHSFQLNVNPHILALPSDNKTKDQFITDIRNSIK